ncbi:acyltransferase family protein, partial [Streptomyces bacillaris]|uniref:acyltransferase family protein n=1 Tax=Streptomyces bacillaris TaxID=68179 RepID=UPI0036DF97AF
DYGYRVSTLLVWALAGLAISRVGLRGRRRLVTLGSTGVGLICAAVVASTLSLGTLEPHSGSAPELLKGLGLACLAIAACCGLASTPVIRTLKPVTALGTMTLTFYLAHIAALGLWTRLTGMLDDKWSILFALSVGSLLGAWLIRRRWGRGPAEWLMASTSSPRYGPRRATA